MPPPLLTEEEATAFGKRAHRNNIVSALFTGAVLLGSGVFYWRHWPLGLLVGLLYANAFEYCYHRFLLHGVGRFSERHQTHHESFGRWDEPLHVSFGCSPGQVVLMIVLNSLLFAFLDLLGAGVGGGVVLSFVAYFVAFEEIHWRVHLGRLPKQLEWIRRHHFAHHKAGSGRYNVFLPLCDKLFSPTPAGRTPLPGTPRL